MRKVHILTDGTLVFLNEKEKTYSQETVRSLRGEGAKRSGNFLRAFQLAARMVRALRN